MTRPNSELPQNLRDLITHLSYVQAIPLGTTQGIPFIALKLAEADTPMIGGNTLTCEFKPSVFNVDYKDHTIAMCIIQFRLNGSDRHIYTASYDLRNDKQYNDCFDLLKMSQYGLLVATQSVHDFVQFDVNFDGGFDPQYIIKGARDLGTGYDPMLFGEVSYGLTMQADSPAALWKYFENITPGEHKWYARMRLQSEKV